MLSLNRVRIQLLALVLAVALPIAGVMTYAWLKAVEASSAAATELLRVTTAALVSDLRRMHRQAEWMLSQIALVRAVRALEPGACAPEARRLQRLHPEFVNLMIWSLSGEVVCSSIPLPPGGAAAAHRTAAFERTARGGGFQVSDVFFGRLTHRHVVVFTYPIAGAAGATAGVLTASVSPDYFDDMLGELELPPGSALAVLDRSLSFVARRPDGEKWRGASARGLAIDQVPAAGQRTAGLVSGMDGVKRLYVGEEVPETGWKVFAGIQSERLLSRQRSWLMWVIAVTLSLIAASGAAAYVIAARLSRQFRSMLRAEQELMGRLLRAEEQERTRISRELHDQVGQDLTALALDLNALRGEAPPEALERAVATASRLIDEVRDVSLALRPPQLDDLGLAAALRAHVEHITRPHGIKAHVEIDLRAAWPSADIEAACFRIAQEAVTNVLRHAEAGNVWVRLKEQRGGLALTVRDDGVGFDLDAALKAAGDLRSLGLRNLFDRAQLAGGRVEIFSRPGAGTEVNAWLPL